MTDDIREMVREASEYGDRLTAGHFDRLTESKRMDGEEAAAHWKTIAEQERDALRMACSALHMAGWRVRGAGVEYDPFKVQPVSALVTFFEEACGS